MYPELMVVPMREELTRLGIEELRTASEVDDVVRQPGTTMVVVNSICGCAAGRMRPAVRIALQHSAVPDKAVTVFAMCWQKPYSTPPSSNRTIGMEIGKCSCVRRPFPYLSSGGSVRPRDSASLLSSRSKKPPHPAEAF